MMMKISGMILGYFLLNYTVFEYEMRIIFGTMAMYVLNFWIFDGSKLYVFRNAVLEYLFCMALDFFNAVFVYPWMNMSVQVDMVMSPRLLLGKNVYNMTMFLVMVIIQFYVNRKKGLETKLMSLISIVLGLCQFFIIRAVYQSNFDGLMENVAKLSIFYTGMVIICYLIVMAVFNKTVELKEKESELEQMKLEQSYQYAYYQKAYAQKEQIRDMRHDMRNQLQTVRYLIVSEENEDKERAKKMLEGLCEKI